MGAQGLGVRFVASVHKNKWVQVGTQDTLSLYKPSSFLGENGEKEEKEEE